MIKKISSGSRSRQEKNFGPGPGEKQILVPVPTKKNLVSVPVKRNLVPAPGPLCTSLDKTLILILGAPLLSFESTSTSTAFDYKITLFGDLIPKTCPKTIEELIGMLPSITAGLQKTNGGKGRPLEYTMLPLSEFAEILGEDLTSDRIFRAIEEHLTLEIQTIFDECDQLRTIVHTLYISSQKAEDFCLDEEINQIVAHQHTIIRLERDIRNRIGKMLVRVRSGNAESSELDQLLIELESQVATQKTQTKQIERGDISQKFKYTLELKEKGVIAVREPETLAIIQNRHPKHQLIVLYTNNELRMNSKEKWITVYFEFLRRIEAHSIPGSRFLFCYFDYDLHPHFQPQYKKLEVREYIGAPVTIPTARVRPETIDRQQSLNGIDSLVRENIKDFSKLEELFIRTRFFID